MALVADARRPVEQARPRRLDRDPRLRLAPGEAQRLGERQANDGLAVVDPAQTVEDARRPRGVRQRVSRPPLPEQRLRHQGQRSGLVQRQDRRLLRDRQRGARVLLGGHRVSRLELDMRQVLHRGPGEPAVPREPYLRIARA